MRKFLCCLNKDRLEIIRGRKNIICFGVLLACACLVMAKMCIRDSRRPVKDFADTFHLEWREGRKPWEVPCDIATPSAIQNELGAEDAKALLRNGCTCVVEAANVPCTPCLLYTSRCV